MSKPILALDIDNTLADTNKELLGLLPNLDITKYPTPGITLDFFRDNPEVYINVRPYEGAVKCVNYLSTFMDIVYLTAREEWAKKITDEWLEKWGFPNKPIVCTNNKLMQVIRLGVSLVIDDAPKEIKNISKLVPVFIYKQPYNKNLAFLGKQVTWLETEWIDRLLFTYYPKTNIR